MHTGKQIKESLVLGPGSSREGPGHLQAPICTTAWAPGERGACTLSNKGINTRMAKRIEAATEGSSVWRRALQNLLAGSSQGAKVRGGDPSLALLLALGSGCPASLSPPPWLSHWAF